jgi:hypothetical protein
MQGERLLALLAALGADCQITQPANPLVTKLRTGARRPAI